MKSSNLTVGDLVACRVNNITTRRTKFVLGYISKIEQNPDYPDKTYEVVWTDKEHARSVVDKKTANNLRNLLNDIMCDRAQNIEFIHTKCEINI